MFAYIKGLCVCAFLVSINCDFLLFVVSLSRSHCLSAPFTSLFYSFLSCVNASCTRAQQTNFIVQYSPRSLSTLSLALQSIIFDSFVITRFKSTDVKSNAGKYAVNLKAAG